MGLCLSATLPHSAFESRSSATHRKHSYFKKKSDARIALASHHSSHRLSTLTGTTDEEFHDAESWLDPVEDDTLSYVGEVIPSCQRTPLSHSVSHGNCGMISSPPGDVLLGNPMHSQSERHSTKLQKRLGELFKESFRDDQRVVDDDIEMGKGGKREHLIPESGNGYERTHPNSDKTPHNVGRAETLDTARCCLSGRARRKKTSPLSLGKNRTAQ